MGFMFGYVIVSTQEVDNKSNNIYLWFLEFNIKAILCNDRGEGHGDIAGAVKEGVQVQFTASKSSLSAPLSFSHSIPREAVNSSPETSRARSKASLIRGMRAEILGNLPRYRDADIIIVDDPLTAFLVRAI